MPKLATTTLTEVSVARLKKAPQNQRIEKADALCQGLILRVSDKGSKSWIVRFRLGGSQLKLALGTWPAVSLADARALAREAREKAAAGIDPRTTRRAKQSDEAPAAPASKRKPETFGDLAAQFLRETAFRGQNTAREFEATVRLHLQPLAETPKDELHRAALGDILAELTMPHRPGGPKPGAARKAYEAARRVTSWAVGRGKLEHDPFAKMAPPQKGAAKDRVLEDPELAILWRAWERVGYPFGPMQRLLLLTGTRRSEAAELTWSELDDPDAPSVWVIPAERSKNGLEHRIGLSPQARALFAAIPRGVGPFVFSTTDGMVPVSGFTTAKRRTDRLAAEINGGKPLPVWSLHDLRRTTRTGLARLGVSREVAERALNHVGGSALERTYNRHRYEAEIARALALWGEHVERTVSGNERAQIFSLRLSG